MSQPAPTLPPEYGPPLSLALAKQVMAAAEAECARHGWPMVIAIVDSSGHLVMLHKLDQAQYGSVEIARLKAETAFRFRRSTKIYEDLITTGGAGLRLLALPNATPLTGGLPILVGGKVVGAIGVSGLQPAQDEQVAQAGLAAIAAGG